jgi:hypothetical protein
MPPISITSLCNAIPNALLHLPVLPTDLQKLFCFFASYSNLHQYDILLLPTKLITQADPRVFSINIISINVEYRSRCNSFFNVSTELFPFTEWNYVYIRREFTDVIFKKYQKWCLRIPHHTLWLTPSTPHQTVQKKASVRML